MLEDCFKKIARKIKEDEKIKGVMGKSDLVKKHKKFMQSLGFSIGPEDEYSCFMGRQAFLEKYLES